MHTAEAGAEDSFIITGDIPAMWLRDSTNQVNPYHELAAADPALRALLCGLIRRQTACLLLDVYANAFNVDASAAPYDTTDISTRPHFLGTRVNALSGAIWERKWATTLLHANNRFWPPFSTGLAAVFDRYATGCPMSLGA